MLRASPARTPPRRAKKGPATFAMDPHIKWSPQQEINYHDYSPLRGKYFLSTTLLDYILQRCLPEDLSDSILVSGTDSNIIFFKTNLSKLKGKKGEERDSLKITAVIVQYISNEIYYQDLRENQVIRYA
jgi:hypothetical protein